MAETLVFTLELKSRIDKELAKVRRGTHAMSTSAVRDIQAFQQKLGVTKNTIGGLTDSLEELRRRKDQAFDTKQLAIYNRAIARTERKIEHLNKAGLRRGQGGASGSMGGMGAGLMGMAGRFAGPAALGFAAFSLGKKAIVEGAELEQNRIAFQTLLQDDEKGSALVESVNKLANATPFANSALLTATKTLLNFGFTNDDVLPTLRNLGDVSGGNAERLSSLSLVMGQVRSAGKLMGQDLLQFINAGFNPLQEMAQTTGKSMGELKEEMSKGTISYEEVASSFQSVTSEGGKFYQMMEKQSESMGGKWSTLVGTFSSKMAELGVSMKPLINPILDFGISIIGGKKITERIQAIQTLQNILSKEKEGNFTLEDRQQLIEQFNAQFGEEVLGKTINVELALDQENFLTEFNELKKKLEKQQIFAEKVDKKTELYGRKEKVNLKIAENEKKLYEIRTGQSAKYKYTSPYKDSSTISVVDLEQAEKVKGNSLKKQRGLIYKELYLQMLKTGATTQADIEILKKRRDELIAPAGVLAFSAQSIPPESKGATYSTGVPYYKGESAELKKLNKEIAKVTNEDKDTEKDTEKEKEKVDKLTASVNTGGKVYKTVNLNIAELIGEMNNHFAEQEFSEEELERVSINGLLRALNGASRIAEA